MEEYTADVTLDDLAFFSCCLCIFLDFFLIWIFFPSQRTVLNEKNDKKKPIHRGKILCQMSLKLVVLILYQIAESHTHFTGTSL